MAEVAEDNHKDHPDHEDDPVHEDDPEDLDDLDHEDHPYQEEDRPGLAGTAIHHRRHLNLDRGHSRSLKNSMKSCRHNRNLHRVLDPGHSRKLKNSMKSCHSNLSLHLVHRMVVLESEALDREPVVTSPHLAMVAWIFRINLNLTSYKF